MTATRRATRRPTHSAARVISKTTAKKFSPGSLQPSGNPRASQRQNLRRDATMLRRSAPALLGLFVCLLAAQHFDTTADAAPDAAAFRVDESATRATLRRDSTDVALAFVNRVGRAVKAHVRVELLDTDGAS